MLLTQTYFLFGSKEEILRLLQSYRLMQTFWNKIVIWLLRRNVFLMGIAITNTIIVNLVCINKWNEQTKHVFHWNILCTNQIDCFHLYCENLHNFCLYNKAFACNRIYIMLYSLWFQIFVEINVSTWLSLTISGAQTKGILYELRAKALYNLVYPLILETISPPY